MKTGLSFRALATALAVLTVAGGVSAGAAEFVKGSPAPEIAGLDLSGQAVRLSSVVRENPYLVILYFFSKNTGEDIAAKLQYLQATHGADKFRIIALGLAEEKQDLADFAARMGITYHVMDPASLEDRTILESAKTLPMTVFVRAGEDRTVEQVLAGGGSSTAKLMASLAENLFRKRKAEALPIVEEAVAASGDRETRELKGYVLLSQGKLDAAESEFGEIASATGLARVSLERGDTKAVVENADKAAGDPYAAALKSAALAREGKVDEAVSALPADAGTVPEWQQSEVANLKGRVAETAGKPEEAAGQYREAVALDPYNVVALSNEGAALRASGNLEGAKQALEKAVETSGGDPAAALLLKQVAAELAAANDTRRGELIRSQIADLGARYKEMKESGALDARDAWSTAPLVLAFLPSGEGGAMVFDRSGMDQLVLRELETGVQASGKAMVVERAMLDQLLQELDLGSSDLASGDVQRRLGRVLSAGALGFVSFVRTGPQVTAYLRVVDTETTEIALQASEILQENDPAPGVSALTAKIVRDFAEKRELKGLIADASSDDAVIVNLGARHGVAVGDGFTVLKEGAPVEVGGRVIARRQVPVGKLTVTEVNDEYAVCKVTARQEGAVFEKEMKIKGLPPEAGT